MNRKFTVKDKIMEDSLEAIWDYRSLSDKYKPTITGGIATQLYAFQFYPELTRPTHDMDLVTVSRMNSENFRRDLGKNLAESLEHYRPKVGVLRHVYEVHLEDEEEYPFFIHSYRWTANGWERQKRSIERQVANANRVVTPSAVISAYVVRPEDLVVGKLSRLNKLEEKGKIPPSFNGKYDLLKGKELATLADEDLSAWLDELTRQKVRLPAFYDSGKEKFRSALDEYVTSKDLFDISLISKLAINKSIDFDEKYYNNILERKE